MASVSYRTLQKSKYCSNTSYVSLFKKLTKRAKSHGMISILGRRSYSNNSDESDDENPENHGKRIRLVVTSLRVDRIAASGLGLARRKIDHSLLAGNIFLNGEKVKKKSQQVVEGNIIKRISETQPSKDNIKFGQVKVVSIGDLTKKGNYHVELLRNKSISLPVQEFWNEHES